MGLSFNVVNLFVTLKSINWPNLNILKWMANIPLKNPDFHILFVVKINSHNLLLANISKYGLFTF
jgi:hypothetical protein